MNLPREVYLQLDALAVHDGMSLSGRVIECHILENLAYQVVFDMSKAAGAGETATIGFESFAGERTSFI